MFLKLAHGSSRSLVDEKTKLTNILNYSLLSVSAKRLARPVGRSDLASVLLGSYPVGDDDFIELPSMKVYSAQLEGFRGPSRPSQPILALLKTLQLSLKPSETALVPSETL